jgi:hypothetical protein
MPLDLSGLKTNIASAYNQAKTSELTETEFADLIATAIDTYVKTGTVNTVVTTPDTINGTGTGTIS